MLDDSRRHRVFDRENVRTTWRGGNVWRDDNLAEVNVTEKTPPPKEAVGKSSTDGRYIQIPLPNHALFTVFNGRGGSFTAEYASRNLLRVLTRSSTFCEYAEKCNAREEYLKGLKEKSDDESTPKAEGSTEEGESKKQKSESDFGFGRAEYDHELMTLLEHSLRDAFVDLDAEILREVQGEEVPDANSAYGAGYDLSWHSLGGCLGHLQGRGYEGGVQGVGALARCPLRRSAGRYPMTTRTPEPRPCAS